MLDPNSHALTETEWQEIAALPAIRNAWSLEGSPNPHDLATRAYGAKFTFQSGFPGYVVDLGMLRGERADVGPIVLRRDSDGHLIVC